MQDNLPFSVFLEGVMVKLDLTQVDVARMGGISQPMVGEYLAGKRYPSKITMLKFFQFLFVRLLQSDAEREQSIAQARADLWTELKGAGATEIKTAIAAVRNARTAVKTNQKKGARNRLIEKETPMGLPTK